MKNFKTCLAMFLLTVGTSAVFAQENTENKDYKPFPHMFVGVQGGAQTTFTDYDQLKLITPTASVSFGGWFTPVVGARLHVNGIWNKGGFDQDIAGTNVNFKYKYRYVTTNLDLLLNMCTLFGRKNYYPVNAYLIGGIGLNYAWDNDDAYAHKSIMPLAWEDNRLNFNARVGAMLDWNFHKHWGLNLEVSANALSDRYNSKVNGKDDWSLTAQIGLAYKFGFKKNTTVKEEETSIQEAPQAEPRDLTLYEQMQSTVNNRMNVWMKRLNGESKADFLARTSDEAIEAKRLEFTKQVSTEMADDRANRSVRDLKYNTQSQQLGVQFTDMPSIALKVPKDDLKNIKSANDLKFTNTVYNLNPGDKFEVLYTDVLNPVTGKKYTYVNAQDAQFVETADYMPLSAVQQDIVNSQRLQAVATQAVQEAKDKNILSDNTTISVKTEMMPTTDGKADYKVSYTYTVKDNFSVKDDFAPGKYEAEKAAASSAMLKIINQTMKDDFAKYIKPGSTVEMKMKGMADASPIHGKIAYNNQYGEIKDQPTKVNGKEQRLTITRATGITSNEQLSLVRAISVKNHILKNVEALKNAKVKDTYEVEVANNEGSQFRRVAVDFILRNAF